MAQRIGKRGADGGIDGIIELAEVKRGKVKDTTAIVQVKGEVLRPIVFVPWIRLFDEADLCLALWYALRIKCELSKTKKERMSGLMILELTL